MTCCVCLFVVIRFHIHEKTHILLCLCALLLCRLRAEVEYVGKGLEPVNQVNHSDHHTADREGEVNHSDQHTADREGEVKHSDPHTADREGEEVKHSDHHTADTEGEVKHSDHHIADRQEETK